MWYYDRTSWENLLVSESASSKHAGLYNVLLFLRKHLAELNCRILEPSILFAQVNPAVSNVLGL